MQIDKFKEVKECLLEAFDRAEEKVLDDASDIVSLFLMEQIEYAFAVLDAESRSDEAELTKTIGE